MIRTCRLFVPARKNYNVFFLNQRPFQAKQTSMEFSFYLGQWKENCLPGKLCNSVKSEFSSFKQHEKVDTDSSQEKKTIKPNSVDFTSEKSKQATEKHNFSSESSNDMTVDLSTLKENIVSEPLINEGDVKPPIAKEAELNSSTTPLVGTPETVTSAFAPFLKNGKTIIDNQEEIIKKIKILAQTGRREMILLKSSLKVLKSREQSYTLTQCCDLFYSLAKLSVVDLPFLDKVADQTLRELSWMKDKVNKDLLISLLHSVCLMRYRNCELIEALCKHLSMLDTELDNYTITKCLYSLTHVNLQSAHLELFINTLSKFKITDFESTRNFLNYIWACVILERQTCVPLEHFHTVLSKSFWEQLSNAGENSIINKIKLCNIGGVASTLKDYKGPIQDKVFLSPVYSKKKKLFMATVKDGLSYIFPRSGFLYSHSYVGSGVFIDVECNLDSSMNPLPLKESSNKSKIAILLMLHNDYCLDGTTFTGINAFKVAQIKSRGYKVLIISDIDFPFKSSLSTKVSYLQEKFKSVLSL